MALVYITGISGAGKSAVRAELQRRGHAAYGTDEDDIAGYYNITTGKRLTRHVPAKERTPEWRVCYNWKAPRMAVSALNSSSPNSQPVFLCGVTANDTTELWDLFSNVFALVLDEPTLRHRITTRTNNNYGKNPHEFADLIQWQQTAAADYTKHGAVLIDATQPVTKVVDTILERLGLPHQAP